MTNYLESKWGTDWIDIDPDSLDETERGEFLYALAAASNPGGFTSLCDQVRIGMWDELRNRFNSNPTPSQDELDMGMYVEEFEPQARQAMLEARRKGYNVTMAGFPKDPALNDEQHMFGFFTLANDTVESLRQHGIEVDSYDDDGSYPPSTNIKFRPLSTDIDTIESQWQSVIDLLPDLGHSASPSPTFLSERFRQRADEDPSGAQNIASWLRASSVANLDVKSILDQFIQEHPDLE